MATKKFSIRALGPLREGHKVEALAILGELDAVGRRRWLLDGRDLISLREAQVKGLGIDFNLTDEENRRRIQLSRKEFPWSVPGEAKNV